MEDRDEAYWKARCKLEIKANTELGRRVRNWKCRYEEECDRNKELELKCQQLEAKIAQLLDKDLKKQQDLPPKKPHLFDFGCVIGLRDDPMQHELPNPETLLHRRSSWAAYLLESKTPQPRIERRNSWLPSVFPVKPPVPIVETTPPAALQPQVIASFPSEDKKISMRAQGLVHLCFPNGITTSEMEFETNNAKIPGAIPFVVKIFGEKKDGSEPKYAICLMSTQLQRSNQEETGVYAPRCYCIVSSFPFFDLFFAILDRLRSVEEQDQHLSSQEIIHLFGTIVRRFVETPVPKPGEWRCYRLPSSLDSIAFQRPSLNRAEEYHFTSLWALPILFSIVELERILHLVGCLCSEVKVVFVSQNLSCLSACVLGLLALLQPLTWVCPVITFVPECKPEFLDAPVPVVAGVKKLDNEFRCRQGVVVVDIDRNTLEMHPRDIESFHQYKLPGFEVLYHTLAKSSGQLYSEDLREPLYSPNEDQESLCEQISRAIYQYMKDLCDDTLETAAIAVTDPKEAFRQQLRATQMYSLYLQSTSHEELPVVAEDSLEYSSESNM